MKQNKMIGAFVGQNNAARLNDAFFEFLKLAGEIRIELREKSYLLDEYAALLFESAYEVMYCEAAEDGAEMVLQLSNMCSPKIEKFKYITHPFFGTARQFMEEHPFACSESMQEAVYTLLLSGELLKGAAEEYTAHTEENLRKAGDAERLDELFDQLCRALGSKRKIKRMTELFCERFLAVPSYAMFLQGAADQMLYFLTRSENGKTAFQVLMEQNEYEQNTHQKQRILKQI